MADSLNDYGPTFQTKILSSLLTDKVFISTIIDIIEVDYFQSDANKWIVKTIENILWSIRLHHHLMHSK